VEPQELDVLVLDVNETLSDLEPLRNRFVAGGLPASSLELWFAMTLRDGFAVTAADGYVSFRDVAADVLRALLAERRSGEADEDTVAAVLSAIAELPAHSDVGPGLRRIHAQGVRVITLTNGATTVSDRLLAESGVLDLLEHRLSVETPRRWKPHPDAYRFAAKTCGTDPARMALVAVHPWDVDGARRAGMRGVWVDRKRTPYPNGMLQPDLRVTDFVALADWFESGRSR
jgi:2-haloacid dehalogenase